MLRAGAAGFVLKGVPAEELQRAVRVVAEGGAWLDPARDPPRPRRLPRRADRRAPSPMRGAAPRSRSPTASGRCSTLIGEGHTNAEIAAELFVGEGTVKTHINHVFSKLDLRDRAAAVIFAYENDLVGDGARRPTRRRPKPASS